MVIDKGIVRVIGLAVGTESELNNAPRRYVLK